MILATQFILGSQSPRRFELLQSVVPVHRIQVVSPKNEDEAGFEDCADIPQIEERLRQIVSVKLHDVRSQIDSLSDATSQICVVCADTVVVAAEESGRPVVLGKPPHSNWQETVRDWFLKYYQDKVHEVWTCFAMDDLSCNEFHIVKTKVAFASVDDWWIDWYCGTDEPIGKAGGYGIQGHAAALVNSVQGSLTNVIGLPVFELTAAFRRLGLIADETSDQ